MKIVENLHNFSKLLNNPGSTGTVLQLHERIFRPPEKTPSLLFYLEKTKLEVFLCVGWEQIFLIYTRAKLRRLS